MEGHQASDTAFDSEWLSAAETYRLATEHMPDGQARVAIGTRAHSGLLRTFAERFEKWREVFENTELPKEFWWATGHEALHQNWVTGDFDTWIDRNFHWKAFGVRFNRADLAKMLPQSPPPRSSVPPPARADDGGLVSSGKALELVVATSRDLNDAAWLLLDAVQLGLIKARAGIQQVAIEGEPIVTAKDKWLEPEDWRGVEDIPPQQWRNGIFTYSYWDATARDAATVRISGLQLDAGSLQTFIASLAPGTGKPASTAGKKPAGRPRADWWDDLLIAMFRRLWEDKWTPRTQAEVVEAMHQWLADNPGDDPDAPRQAGDTVLKERARKLLEGLDLGR